MILAPADLLLWSRCHRQWVRSCLGPNGREPAFPRDMTGESNLRETARVIVRGIAARQPGAVDVAAAELAPEDGPPIAAVTHLSLDEGRMERWAQATRDAMAKHRAVAHGVLLAHGQTVLIDLLLWHPKLDGWKAMLFRPGTGFRGVYGTEAAMVAWAAREADVQLVELEIAYLNKAFRSAEVSGTAGADGEPFRGSNSLRRSMRATAAIGDLVSSLKSAAQGEPVSADYRCAGGCRLCVPRSGDADDRFSVFTLHKGAHLAKELARDGVTDIRQLDASSRRISARQRIQIAAVLEDRTFVDVPALSRFLDGLEHPIHYLDFEAFAPSWPPVTGVGPYEHVPVIASIHTEERAGAEPRHDAFVSRPGHDERRGMYRWLLEQLGDRGSIVVFSKGFESAMVRQLSAHAGDEVTGGEMISRMVDLLDPFAGFLVYHPDQRGKVSLKRVLPAFTDAHYDDSPLRDGMHANLAYTRHVDRAVDDAAARAAEHTETALERFGTVPPAPLVSTDDIATYCAVDTMAMVHLVETLRRLVADRSR